LLKPIIYYWFQQLGPAQIIYSKYIILVIKMKV